jgi:hypothetical protein
MTTRDGDAVARMNEQLPCSRCVPRCRLSFDPSFERFRPIYLNLPSKSDTCSVCELFIAGNKKQNKFGF